MTIRPSVSDLTQRNIDAIAKMERAARDQRSLGERVADRFAATVGSWTFIVSQSLVLLVWIIVNLLAAFNHWDPYPFILLNLVLSFQAAYASPIIMMSQNRQAKLDERRNQLDLQINLLSEQENTEMLHLLRRLCVHFKINDEASGAALAMESQTNPEEVIRQIVQTDPSKRPSGHGP